jgi:hypothetical protein
MTKVGEALAELHTVSRNKHSCFVDTLTSIGREIQNKETLSDYQSETLSFDDIEDTLELFDESVTLFLKLCELLQVTTNDETLNELEKVRTKLRQPGMNTFTLTHGDFCPDNIFINFSIQMNDNNQHNNEIVIHWIKFIDFTKSAFRHAFLDVVYPRMLWPSCWCIKQLSRTVVKRFEHSYLSTFLKLRQSQNFNDVTVDNVTSKFEWFLSNLIEASTYHLLVTTTYHLEEAWNSPPEKSYGTMTLREAILRRFDSYLQLFERSSRSQHATSRYQNLRHTMNNFFRKLKKAWPESTHSKD